MSELGTCDLCEKDARWAVVVKGCREHKDALNYAIKKAIDNRDYTEALLSTLNYYHNCVLNKKTIDLILDQFEKRCEDFKKEQEL